MQSQLAKFAELSENSKWVVSGFEQIQMRRKLDPPIFVGPILLRLYDLFGFRGPRRVPCVEHCLQGARYLAEYPNAATATSSFIQANPTRDFGETSRSDIEDLGVDPGSIPSQCRECWQ